MVWKIHEARWIMMNLAHAEADRHSRHEIEGGLWSICPEAEVVWAQGGEEDGLVLSADPMWLDAESNAEAVGFERIRIEKERTREVEDILGVVLGGLRAAPRQVFF